VNFGPTELIVLFFIIGVVALVVEIWAIVDAASRPNQAWQSIGSSKGGWIAGIAVTAFLCGFVGAILSIVYLTSVRTKLKEAQGPA